MDRLTPEERSKNMAAIRSKDTKPEILLRKWLFARGYRFRVNVKYISGHPDIFLRKYNTAIFVHGCFWHRHSGCRYSYMPKSRLEFWNHKFEQNINRDEIVKDDLLQSGIKYLVVWECAIKRMVRNMEFQESVLSEIERFLQSDIVCFEIGLLSHENDNKTIH